MTHLWLRAEQRDNETRVGLTPEGAAQLLSDGMSITVEESDSRVIPTQEYIDAGCAIAPAGSWPDAPPEAIIFGLKELPEDGTPLTHTHIMFGHAYKGQASGKILLQRFIAGGGTLLDLEYLTDPDGRRVAAFGYWAGFAGAAVALKCWAAQQRQTVVDRIRPYPDAQALTAALQTELSGLTRPDALIIGALGRVGTGAADLLTALECPVTGWDLAETSHGGPYPEILSHGIFVNCILAQENTPVFVQPDAPESPRNLRVIADIACDPDSMFNPVKVYDRATSWDEPALRVHNAPPLDVMAIDNLPSLLPLESSVDYAKQLLPTLAALESDPHAVWARARAIFQENIR